MGSAVLFYITQHKDVESFALSFERMGRIEGDLTMIRPRLTGTEQDGTPFSFSADTATQEDAKTMRIRLRKLSGQMMMMDGRQLHLVANAGQYDAAAHTLFAYNGVRVTTSDGYDMRTTAATFDVKAGNVRGDERVVSEGPTGHLEADAFVADKKTRRDIFTGHVHMLLNPKAAESKGSGAKGKGGAKSGKTKTPVEAKADAAPEPEIAAPAGAEAAPALRLSTTEAGQ